MAPLSGATSLDLCKRPSALYREIRKQDQGDQAPVVRGQLRAPSGISHPQGDFPPPWEIPPPTMEWEFPPPGGFPTPPGNPTPYNGVGIPTPRGTSHPPGKSHHLQYGGSFIL